MVENIAGLRKYAPTEKTKLQLDAVMKVVELVSDGNISVRQIAETAGISEDDVVKLVLELGTWLGQSINAGKGAVVYEYSQAPGEVVEDIEGVLGQMDLFKTNTENYVVLPPGLEAEKVGRDMSKSVAQIVRGAPDETMLRRWLLRKHHSIRQVLGFEMVAAVHRFAQLGRLQDLEHLVARGNGNPQLAVVLVEAYDLLDVARGDALAALDELASGTIVDIDRIGVLVARVAWLAEASFGRIQRRLEMAREGAGDVAPIVSALKRLCHGTHLRPGRVGELTDGQVRCLCRAVGLDIEGACHKEVETVRGWVMETNPSDADLLIADGVRALRAGCGEVFKESLKKRACGQLDWADSLNEALAKASSTELEHVK